MDPYPSPCITIMVASIIFCNRVIEAEPKADVTKGVGRILQRFVSNI